MSVGRMVAVLAVALCFGGVVAAVANPGKELGAAFAMIAAILAALAIAAVLTLLARAFRAPLSRAVAVALVVGGLIVFPVHAYFYTDASFEAEGGSVGRCSGILPLSQLVYYGFANETYGDLYYFASCND
jgi:ABC-type glucose/galactose transport system permease subunit